MSTAKQNPGMLPPVEKTLQVALPPEQAFELFTGGLATWWPLESHSVSEGNAVSCHVERRVGGRVYEVDADGGEAIWGTVLAWEPPRRFMTTWHPGKDAALATELEVLFEAAGGGTRLSLTHRNWEVLGENAAKSQQGYNTGWDFVLGHYMAEVEANSTQ
ncbi:MAG: SRPBCC family protein [Anaerolineae bacterium]|nr:SRPBCC family protein [Anaerolineae bacterium]